MASVNKDEVLANFQACTGIEDVAEAMLWLDESDWDLLTAVKNALPQESQTLPSDIDATTNDSTTTNNDTEMTNGIQETVSPDFTNPPTTSRRKPTKMLDFDVWYLDKLVKIQISDHSTVGALKAMVLAKTGIPPCRQRLTGWETVPTSDEVRIKTLHLPKENELSLTLENQSPMELEVLERPETIYTFRVSDETNSRQYVIRETGQQSISYIKLEVQRLTGIPVVEQQWFGWPRGLAETSLLYESHLTLPIHELTLRDARDNKIYVDLMDSDSSPEEYEDASETLTAEDEMFEEDHISRRVEPMIPDDVEDEVSGAIHFAERFSLRYGDARPAFYQGSLEDAIKEACMKPAKERKLLAIYLHHDRSVLSNVFCTELLCFESVLQTLSANFVIWGWDITTDPNKDRFLLTVSQALGTPVADTISSIQIESLPALIIITRSRSNTELFNVINGNIGISELLTMLIHAVEVYAEMQKAEMLEEEERNKREMIKTEQDKAFEQSLLLDMAKEEAKKKQEQLAYEEKERIARALKEKEEKLLAERQAMKSKLPAEPEEGSREATVKIRFRCPQGGTMERRFLTTHNLQMIFNYLLVQGYKTDEYKVILSWPKRDLTLMNPLSTLGELQLHPQETMILEER